MKRIRRKISDMTCKVKRVFSFRQDPIVKRQQAQSTKPENATTKKLLSR